MLGKYYKTEYRNQKSGDTDFTIVPDTYNEYVQDGIIRCHGQIGIYEQSTPLELSGNFHDGIFYVNKCFIPFNSEETSIKLLEHICRDLSDTSMKRIAEASNNNLFWLSEQRNAKAVLGRILNNKKDKNRIIRNILGKLDQLKTQEILVKELMQLDIPISKIETLYKKGISMTGLRENPYKYFVKYDIPIFQADMFMQSMGKFNAYSLNRLCGYTMLAAKTLTNNGFTCCTVSQLKDFVNALMYRKGFTAIKIDLYLINLCISKLSNVFSYYLYNNVLYVYFNNIFEEENIAIKHVARLQNNVRTFQPATTIEKIEQKFKIKYNLEQRQVFNALRQSGIKVLTGPPGSGKTAVIKGLIEFFGKNKSIKLAATTGMAANVMSASGEFITETVHSMLNVMPFDNDTKSKDLNDPVDADLIIVDEVSMMGLGLFSKLVRAVKSGSILLLVGDEDQLQSVEYGNVLHELISSQKIEVYRLTEVIRQSGTICQNAKLINSGNRNLIQDNTYIINHFDSEEDLRNALITEYCHINNENQGNNKQILCPIKSGYISTTAINEILQPKNNKESVTYGNTTYYIGNKIIMTKNNNKKHYINGDIGFIKDISNEIMTVEFKNKTLELDREDYQYMDLAYSITIHKSQGSEFDDVFIVLPPDAEHMMTRRLLYTASTRAKKSVHIYYMQDSLNKAIDNKKETIRVSLLKDRLLEYLKNNT